MLALLTLITALSSPVSVVTTSSPPVSISVVQTAPYLLNASSTNSSQAVQDWVCTVVSGAATVSDNNLFCSLPATITIPGSGSTVSNGLARFATAGTYTAYFSTTQGVYSCLVTFPSNYFAGYTNPITFNAGTLGSNINASIGSYLSGQSGLSAWSYSIGDYYTRSPTCWSYPIHGWSAFLNGYTVNTNNLTYILHLISPHWAVFAGHVTGYGPLLPGPIICQGEDGKSYTNGIISAATSFMPGTDVALAEFSNAWPSSVFFPLEVFPTNIFSYFGTNTGYGYTEGTEMLWERHNSGLVDVGVVNANPGFLYFSQATGVPPNTSFYEAYGTPGDSSSPFYFVMGTNLVFGFALYASSLQGPLVSYPAVMSWIQTTISPDTVNFVNLSGYPTY